MKSIRNIALSAFLTLGVFTTATLVSCDPDPCKDVTCVNGGTCVSGTCNCPTGYEGATCATLSREKFLGTYNGTETCTVGSDNYSITLSSNSEEVKLTYQNVYNQGFSAVCTITKTNEFTFNTTTNGVTYSGTGTLNVNTINVEYTITDALTSNTCTFVGTK